MANICASVGNCGITSALLKHDYSELITAVTLRKYEVGYLGNLDEKNIRNPKGMAKRSSCRNLS